MESSFTCLKRVSDTSILPLKLFPLSYQTLPIFLNIPFRHWQELPLSTK